MKRSNIMALMISLSLVLLLGSSYALLRSREVGSNPYVINVGNLQVTFEDNQTEKLSLENMYPMSDKEGSSQSKELGFVVKNTGTVESYYDITLEETSTNPEFKSVISFISNKDNQGYNNPKTLGEDKYIDVGGNASSSYKVKIWLDYNADNTYMDKTFTAKVVLNSFQESSYAKDVIKSKLVKYEESSKEDFTGGLVAVNTNGDLYNETDESQKVREYRYSGPSVNNYVTFNDELWRIVGVFKDENGEHLKIVRNEVIKQTNFPATFEASDTVYNIKSTNTDGEWAFWNKKASGEFENNDWATAGLQYWLNAGYGVETESPDAGYMSYLSKNYKGMIEDKTKYYLGTVTYYNKDTNGGSESVWEIKDTVNEAYKNERAVTGCEGGIGPASNSNRETLQNNTTCRVWANNQATWAGRIALLYPSDYGYSADSKYWNTKLGYTTFNGTASDSSWLQKTVNLKFHEWLLSPGSYDAYNVAYWYIIANVSNAYVSNDYLGVRPTLYLKNNVKITSGEGTQENPYNLTY